MATRKQKQQRPRHIPQRTCVVCGEKGDKRSFTRVVRTPDGPVVVDPTGKLAGRGAYICDKRLCWETAVAQPRHLSNALKTNISTENLAALASYYANMTRQPPASLSQPGAAVEGKS